MGSIDEQIKQGIDCMDDELKKDARFSDEKSNHIQAVLKINSDGVQDYIFAVSYLDSQCKFIHFYNARSFPYIGK